MNILHTESSLNWGGQEMRTLEEIQWLNQQGYQAWIAAHPDSEIIKYAQQWAVPYVEIPFRGSFNVTALRKLFAFCKHNEIVLVHAHSSRDAAHVAWLKWLGGYKVIRGLHIDVDHAFKQDAAHRFLWKYGQDFAIPTAQIIYEKLKKVYQVADAEVVGESINLATFNCTISKDCVREELGVLPDTKLIVNIGMIRPDKGQSYLARAVDDIVQCSPNVEVVFVGKGTESRYEDDLLKEIEQCVSRQKVRMLGYRSDVASIMAAADCVVLASTGVEAQSRIVPQAFAMKTPVIATDVGGVSELVKPGVRGVLIPPSDAVAISSAVCDLLENGCPYDLDVAYQFAVNNLSFDAKMNDTVAIYEKLLAPECST